MRHRICAGTGLGNPDRVKLDNKNLSRIKDDFAEDFLDKYIRTSEYWSDFNGFDASCKRDHITVGIEPAYQYERLFIVSIQREKGDSYIQRGKAWGGYGSGIAQTTKYYQDYKRKSKFVKFIDIWHEHYFGEK